MIHYLLTLAIFFTLFAIEAWGLNLQFGLTGILDFTYITFVAIGAYFAGVAALTPSTHGGMGGNYILGLQLPFPISPVIGGLAAALLGVIVGIIGLRRLRSDYLAIVTVSVGQIVWMAIGNDKNMFNGWDGIVGVPEPYNSIFNLNTNNYAWPFLGISLIVAAIIFWAVHALTQSPYGRILRAIREDENVVSALGKNVFKYRMSAFVIGAFVAGISGALQIEYIGAWNPSGWQTLETFIIWAAMLVGGRGNNRGMLLGTFLVPVLFTEATRWIQIPAHPLLMEALRGMAIGLLMVLVVRFRPQGIIPERKRIFKLRNIPNLEEDVANGHTTQG